MELSNCRHVKTKTSSATPKPPLKEAQIPVLPEPEAKILRNHLKQSLASMPLSIAPIKNFEELSPEKLKKLGTHLICIVLT